MAENKPAEIFESVDSVVMVMSWPLQDKTFLEETMIFDSDDTWRYPPWGIWGRIVSI